MMMEIKTKYEEFISKREEAEQIQRIEKGEQLRI